MCHVAAERERCDCSSGGARLAMDIRSLFFPGGEASADASGVNDPNYKFYSNELACQPDGDLCDNCHEKWDGNYELLEMHHGYIQWFFPVFENAGMNFESKPLSKTGAALIRASPECGERVLRSYKVMLRFYGLDLADERTGQLKRDADPEARLDNLNCSPHNWLRVSRILTSLGELGFRRFKRPLLDHLQREIEDGALANAAQSYARFWLPLVDQEGTEHYNAKTREEDADREDGALFKAGGRLA